MFTKANLSSIYLFFDEYLSKDYGAHFEEHIPDLIDTFDALLLDDLSLAPDELFTASINDPILITISADYHGTCGIFFNYTFTLVNSGFGNNAHKSKGEQINLWRTIDVPNYETFRAIYNLCNVDEVKKLRDEKKYEELIERGLPFKNMSFYEEIYKNELFSPSDKEEYFYYGIENESYFVRFAEVDNSWIVNNLEEFVKIYNLYPRDNPFIQRALNNQLMFDGYNLYAYPQKSGSCSFFSLYWANIFMSCHIHGAEGTMKKLIAYIDKRTTHFTEQIESLQDIRAWDNLTSYQTVEILGLCDLANYHNLTRVSGIALNSFIFRNLRFDSSEESHHLMTVSVQDILDLLNDFRNGVRYDINEIDAILMKYKRMHIPKTVWIELLILYNWYTADRSKIIFSPGSTQVSKILPLTVEEASVVMSVSNITQLDLYPAFEKYIGTAHEATESLFVRGEINDILYFKDSSDIRAANILELSLSRAFNPSYVQEIMVKYIYRDLKAKSTKYIRYYLFIYYDDVAISDSLNKWSMENKPAKKLNLQKVEIWCNSFSEFTISTIKERLETDKAFLVQGEIPKGITQVKLVDGRYLVNEVPYLLWEKVTGILDYVLFRLGFENPVVLVNYYDNSEVFCYEEVMVNKKIKLNVAQIKDGIATYNGNRVYFGHEFYDWKFFNLPLYGPCFITEDTNEYGYKTYTIRGRTATGTREEKLFCGSQFGPEAVYFEFPISKSEMFPIMNEDDIYLLYNIQSIYGPRKENFGNNPDFSIVDSIVPWYSILKKIIPTWNDTTNYMLQEKEYDFTELFKSESLVILKDFLRSQANLKETGISGIAESDDRDSYAQSLRKFIKTSFTCNLTCDLPDLNNLIATIKRYKIDLKKHTIEDFRYGILSMFIASADAGLKVIACNIILEVLYRLKYIFNNCDTATCTEIAEHLEILEAPLAITKTYMKNFEVYFIATFGNFVKQEQWNKIEFINSDLDNDIKRVHQFMMGKGKSSVITPLILFNRIFKGEIPYVIVPKHLKVQTVNTIRNFPFVDPDCVKTNQEICMMFLSNQFKVPQYNLIRRKRLGLPTAPNTYTFIIDEFDMLYDPMASTLNVTISQNKWLDNEKIRKVFDLVDTGRVPGTEPYIQEAQNALNSSMTEGINYGMGHRDGRTVVPYLRKDTPLEDSKFASVIYTLVLTILYYKNRNYMLREEDYTYIVKQFGRYIENLYSIPGKIVVGEGEYLFNYFVRKNNEERKYFFIWYTTNVISEHVKVSQEICNMSFIDIMTVDVKQVGYTGTVNLILPDKISASDYEPEIIRDYDEAVNVYYAITGKADVSVNELYVAGRDLGPRLMELLRSSRYSCLIDAIAHFRNDENEKVVKYISEQMGGRNMVFLDEKDTKKVYLYERNEVVPYFIGVNALRPFFFYSQKNCVGIDFRQPSDMVGLILLDGTVKYTDAAQAVYRLRKLNRGHKVDILFAGSGINDKVTLYKLLLNNEKRAMERREPYRIVQRIKNLGRRNREIGSHLELSYFSFQGHNWNYEQLVELLIKNIHVSSINRSWLEGVSHAQLMEVLLGGTGTVLEKQLNVQQEMEMAKEMTGEMERPSKIPNNKVFHFITSLHIDEMMAQFNTFKHITEGFRCSLNILNGLFWEPRAHIIFYVEIFPGMYIIEPERAGLYYYDRFPIYSMDGELINKSFFSELDKIISPPPLLNICRNIYTLSVEEEWRNRHDIIERALLAYLNTFIRDFKYASLDTLDRKFKIPEYHYTPQITHFGLDRNIHTIEKGYLGKEPHFTVEPHTSSNFISDFVSVSELFGKAMEID